MAERQIKAFYISHYIILVITALVDFINPRIPNWLYKEYNLYNDPQFLEGRQPCTVKYHKKIMSN